MADTTQFNQQSFAASRPDGNGTGHSLQQDFSRIGTDLVDALGNRAEAIVNEQKSRAATEIASLAGMVRNAAQCIEQGERGVVTEYATTAADGIDRFAERLRVSSWRVLAADVEDFARRWPAVFTASTAAIGFLLGRMLMTPGDDSAIGREGRPDTGAVQPVARPESVGIGGSLSGDGPAGGFGVPGSGETL